MSRACRLIAVLTSHNRRAGTLACLERFAISAAQAGITPRAILVDDGSSDGTAAAVREAFAWVKVLEGDGSLFWNRGMHRGQAQAMHDADYDFLLWLNDDTNLVIDALQRLLNTAQALQAETGRAGIVVGATCDVQSGQLTYSGQARTSRWKPFALKKVHSLDRAVPCDTMNGNVVLLPAEVVALVGNLDPVFEHSGGDIDYGLRARALGVPLRVAAGFVGECSNNPTSGGFNDRSLPLRQRWNHMHSRKGLPVGTWLPLTRKHGGWLWPLHFAWPYAKVIGSSCVAKLRRP